MKIWKKSYEIKIARWILPILNWAKKVTIPGFNKIPIYDVGIFFYKGLKDGAISTRAASVSFNIFIAVFPLIIFIFTLIPILPIKNFQTELLEIIASMVPNTVYYSIQKTIEDIIIIPHSGLLSIGFILAIYFSSNGIVSLISAFNASVNIIDTRRWWEVRLISLLLIGILSTLVLSGVTLITFTQKVLDLLVREEIMKQDFLYYLVSLGKWFVIFALFYFAYSFLFYLGPAKRSKWKFISAGGTLATILSIIVTLGFSYYINQFGKYNALYGSIGAIPVIMLMIYYNCASLIIGFELNVGIIAAHRKNSESEKLQCTDQELK